MPFGFAVDPDEYRKNSGCSDGSGSAGQTALRANSPS
jgi:hypothetical protein